MAETPTRRGGDPERWRAEAETRVASLAKPPGALGTLEEWYVTLCVAQETLRPAVSGGALVFVADNGCKKADAALSPWPLSWPRPTTDTPHWSHYRRCRRSWAAARRGDQWNRPRRRPAMAPWSAIQAFPSRDPWTRTRMEGCSPTIE